MEKKCTDISVALSAYLDNELSEKKGQDIKAHLEICDKCRIELDELRKTELMLKNAFAFDEREADFSGIWENIESNMNFKPSLWQQLKQVMSKPWVWMPMVVAGAAACLLVCIIPGQQQTAATYVQIESVYSSTGQVLVMQTPETGSPLIWILPETTKEAG